MNNNMNLTMERIEKNGTFKTPAVLLDAESGRIELTGRSFPEDSYVFYKPLINWIQEYIQEPNQQTHINIKLEYMNSNSLKYIYMLLKDLEKLHRCGNEVLVNWYLEFDDEDMEATCDYCQDLISLPFEKVMVA